ncbi:MAG: hypothetical protein ACLP6G_20245 [Terriglobales bacterium]
MLEELQAILSSETFSSSKRGQQFLQYIVEESLAGRGHLLKERSIGVDLFSRSPSYDTGNDSVVRVAAGDVRQRLKQYQEHEGASRPVLIDLPLGSYVPEFNFAPGVASRRLSVRIPILLRFAVLTGVVVLLAGTVYLLTRSRVTALDAFWMPLKSTSSPVLICIANPDAYYFPHAEDRLGPKRKPGDVVHIEEIAPKSVVHPDDAEVAVELSSFLGAKSITTRMRSSTLTSFEELRASPALMIGAYSNQWTLQMTKELHFAFVQPAGQDWGIREQTAPWRHWETPNELTAPQSTVLDYGRDYGLVSRIFNRETGQAFVAIGGIRSPGTVAAAECVMSAPCLETALKNAPRDWERKNLQIVITAKVLSDTPGAPEVIAAYFW